MICDKCIFSVLNRISQECRSASSSFRQLSLAPPLIVGWVRRSPMGGEGDIFRRRSVLVKAASQSLSLDGELSCARWRVVKKTFSEELEGISWLSRVRRVIKGIKFLRMAWSDFWIGLALMWWWTLFTSVCGYSDPRSSRWDVYREYVWYAVFICIGSSYIFIRVCDDADRLLVWKVRVTGRAILVIWGNTQQSVSDMLEGRRAYEPWLDEDSCV